MPSLLSPLVPPFCSVKAVMTFLSTSKDLLISMLSLAYWPVVPVSPCFSEPARSTSYSLLTVTVSELCFKSCDSTVRQNMVCDLEDKSFKLWDARTLFLEPNLKSSIASSGVAHSNTYRFSTTNWSFFVHLILRPWAYFYRSTPAYVPPATFLEPRLLIELELSKSNTFSL
jgi:hypothetical protein